MAYADLDALVAAEYDGFADIAPCYPPGDFRFGIAVPPLPFDAPAFAGLTNASAPQTLAGVPAWALRVVETQDASRAWVVTAGDAAAIREIPVPPYDPAAWSRAVWQATQNRTPGSAARRASGMGASHSSQWVRLSPWGSSLRARAMASSMLSSICSCTAPSLVQPPAMSHLLRYLVYRYS